MVAEVLMWVVALGVGWVMAWALRRAQGLSM